MSKKSRDDAALRELLHTAFHEQIAEPSPEWFAMEQNIFRGDLQRFLGTTYEEMLAFILEGTGITAAQFNADSPKPLESLYGELQREVNLGWNPAASPTREIIRMASNSRCIIYSPEEDRALCEVGRFIIKSRTYIEHDEPRHFGCSETAMRRRALGAGTEIPESSLVTMQRGFLEEAGVVIPSECLVSLTKGTPQPHDHESSVYRCSMTFADSETRRLRIRSIVVSHVFGLDITTLGMRRLEEWADYCPTVTKRDDLLLVEDQGVLLAHKALPLESSWRALLRARLLEQAKQ